MGGFGGGFGRGFGRPGFGLLVRWGFGLEMLGPGGTRFGEFRIEGLGVDYLRFEDFLKQCKVVF